MPYLADAGNHSHYSFEWVRTPQLNASEHRHQHERHVCIFLATKTFAKHHELNVTFPSIRERIIMPAKAAGLETTIVAASSRGEDWEDFDRAATPAFDEAGTLAKVLAPPFMHGVAVQQFSKTCASVRLLREHLATMPKPRRNRCEWYIKTRPEFELLSEVALATFRRDAVNARVRFYRGPIRLQYGSSVGGPFAMENRRHATFANTTDTLVADDMFFALHADVAERAFEDCDGYDRTGRARPDLGHMLQFDVTNARHWKAKLIDTQPTDLRAIFHCGHMCEGRGGHKVPSGPVNMPPNEWQRSFEPKEPPKGHIHVSFPRGDFRPVTQAARDRAEVMSKESV